MKWRAVTKNEKLRISVANIRLLLLWKIILSLTKIEPLPSFRLIPAGLWTLTKEKSKQQSSAAAAGSRVVKRQLWPAEKRQQEDWKENTQLTAPWNGNFIFFMTLQGYCVCVWEVPLHSTVTEYNWHGKTLWTVNRFSTFSFNYIYCNVPSHTVKYTYYNITDFWLILCFCTYISAIWRQHDLYPLKYFNILIL